MNRVFVVSLLGAVSLLAASDARANLQLSTAKSKAYPAGSESFEIPFECPHSRGAGTPRLRSGTRIRFSYRNSPSPSLRSNQYIDFLRPALNGNIDYYSCILRMQERIYGKLDEICRRRNGENRCSEATLVRGMHFFPNYHAVIGKSALRRGAAPAWVLGEDPQDGGTLPRMSGEGLRHVRTACRIPQRGESRRAAFTLPFIFGELARIGRENPSCAEQLKRDYLRVLADEQLPTCTPRSRSSGCVRIRRATSNVLAFVGAAVPGGGLHLDRAVGACVVSSRDPASVLKDLALDAEMAGKCVTPARGESRVVSYERETGNTGKVRYRLDRSKDGSTYTATLNLNFVSTRGKADPALDRVWKNHVNRCLNQETSLHPAFNDLLTGPPAIRLAVSDDPVPGVPPTEVLISSTGRSNHINWSDQDYRDCRIMVHEMLHHLGLEDEYGEQVIGYMLDSSKGSLRSMRDADRGFFNAFDCRVPSRPSSIMGNHETATNIALYGNAKGTGRRRRPPGSMLMPAHARVIAFPGCMSRNSAYYRCIEGSVRTSRGHYGEGCPRGRPPACSNGSTSWLD